MAVMEDERVVLTKTNPDPEVQHYVCHCTDAKIAACGLNVANEEWVPFDEADDAKDCPLCVLAWPPGSATCPWGCGCSCASEYDLFCGPCVCHI